MLPHSAIYIKYIAALLIFIVQLVDICDVFSRLRFYFRIHMRSIISNIHTADTRISSYINITSRNILFRIEMRGQRRPIGKTINIYTAINVIRNRASYTNIVTKRVINTGSLSEINENLFFIHSAIRQLTTEIRHIISRN